MPATRRPALLTMPITAMANVPQPLTPDDERQPAEEKPAPARGVWRSEELLGDRAEVQILHNGEVYRLRRTRQGKLILYK